MEEFLQKDQLVEEEVVQEVEVNETEVTEDIELDVQKAVVETLAAEKVERDEHIADLENENVRLKAENEEFKKKITSLEAKLAECEAELSKVGDILAANSEKEASNQIALLDRNVELSDRFVGETREQVLEVIKEARDKAEEEGRIRRAQILESVLLANESTGELAKKRDALEKFFKDNANIISGPVLAELERCGISHKHGEEYLLPSEIIRRTY
jgi:hypothetical protein